MAHLGDFDASTVLYGKFTTYRPSTGAAFTLGGTPALSVYKDNSTTQSTTGVTLTADFDSVTGLNHFAIDTSADGTFYAAGSFFDIVITTGTVDSVSVVGAVVASFTIRKNSALKPTTAGRTLVVDAAGLADANTVKVGPTGSGSAQTARDIGASVLLSSGTGTGQLDFTSGVVKANVTQYNGSNATSASGRPEVNVSHWLGTAASTPTVAGVPNVNVKTWNDLATVALPLVPTTAGRTLDVSTGGEAGVDWANVGSPTTTLALTGTTIASTQKVDLETIKTNPVVNAGTVTFPTTATLASTTNITAGTVTTATNVTTVNGLAAGVITAASIAADAITDAKVASDVTIASVTGSVGSVTGLTAATVHSDLDDIQARLPAALISGRIDATVGAMQANVMTAAAAASDLTTELQAGLSTLDAAGVRAAVGLASANLDTQLSTIDDFLDTEIAAIKAVTDKLDDTVELTSDGYIFTVNALQQAPSSGATAADIADAVWDEAIAGHAISGSTGEALSAAGASGDPWITALPGAYSSGQAGFIVGTNLNATVSSRATQTSVDTIDDFVDTEIAAIKAKTDNLPADPADASDIAAGIAALPTAIEVADAILTRQLDDPTPGSGTRDLLNAARFIRNGFSISGSTLTVLQEDDTTPAYTRNLTTDAAADPIVGVD